MDQGCGSHGGCACHGKEAGVPAPESPERAQDLAIEAAQINGVPLQRPGESIDDATLRQRACTELLRQAAQRAGLLDASDPPAIDGVPSEAASDAIEALIERELILPEPSEDACRRHHATHLARYSTGARTRARHILFAVTPGVNVVTLRQRAESILLDLRCHDGDKARAAAAFAAAARQWSNCPSAVDGGELGWLTAADCAPEFARELFGQVEIGVLPRLVHSRFGLHVVEVLAREAGTVQPFEAVHGAIALALRQQAYVTALRQYLALLAGAAQVQGVALDASTTPLVQ